LLESGSVKDSKIDGEREERKPEQGRRKGICFGCHTT